MYTDDCVLMCTYTYVCVCVRVCACVVFTSCECAADAHSFWHPTSARSAVSVHAPVADADFTQVPSRTHATSHVASEVKKSFEQSS
jgi:hypothetical protein